MPNNAYIYLDGLTSAVKDNNQTAINHAIYDMAQSSHIDVFMYVHEGYRKKLETYIKDNPFPENQLAMHKLELAYLLQNNIEKMVKTSTQIQETMLNIMVIGKK